VPVPPIMQHPVLHLSSEHGPLQGKSPAGLNTGCATSLTPLVAAAIRQPDILHCLCRWPNQLLATSELCRPAWVVPTSEADCSRLMAGQSNTVVGSDRGASYAGAHTMPLDHPALREAEASMPSPHQLQRCRTAGAGRGGLSLPGQAGPSTLTNLLMGLASRRTAGARPASSHGAWLLSSLAGPDSITRVSPEPTPPSSRLQLAQHQDTFLLQSNPSALLIADTQQPYVSGGSSQRAPPGEGVSIESATTELLGSASSPPSPDRPSAAARTSAQSRAGHLARVLKHSKSGHAGRAHASSTSLALARGGSRGQSLSGAAR
jgi:hypothetical protein